MIVLGPANGVLMKIWQCYDGLAAQQWYYTADDRISLENQGMLTCPPQLVQLLMRNLQDNVLT